MTSCLLHFAYKNVNKYLHIIGTRPYNTNTQVIKISSSLMQLITFCHNCTTFYYTHITIVNSKLLFDFIMNNCLSMDFSSSN